MQTTQRCIVISKLKYKDYDLIVKCYTNQKGIVSYLLKGILKSKKSLAKAVYFQELSQLNIEENYKPNRSLQYIKEVKFSYLYQTLHSNVYKSAIVLFIAEVLNATLKEEVPNAPLFNFLETALQYLDHQDEAFANFHLLFLVKLTRYLGFQPKAPKPNDLFFNLQSGVFERQATNNYSISNHNFTLLKQLLGTNFDTLSTIKINATQRQDFLNMLLHYFELHLDGFKKPKSLQVLNQVFR